MSELLLFQLSYILHGVVGALARVLVHIYNYRLEFIEMHRVISHLGLGAIAGYLTFLLVAFYGWTNHLTAVAFGYMAPSVVEHLLKKGELGAPIGE